MPPAKLTNGAKWATIERREGKWVVRSSAGTVRQFDRYRQAEQYAKRMIR